MAKTNKDTSALAIGGFRKFNRYLSIERDSDGRFYIRSHHILAAIHFINLATWEGPFAEWCKAIMLNSVTEKE